MYNKKNFLFKNFHFLRSTNHVSRDNMMVPRTTFQKIIWWYLAKSRLGKIRDNRRSNLRLFLPPRE